MLNILRKIWKTGTVTKKFPVDDAPARFRGKPVISSKECTGCQACVNSCPTNAVGFSQNGEMIDLSLSYSHCILCGVCAEVCETHTIQTTNEYRLATKNKNDLIQTVQVSFAMEDLIAVGEAGKR
ncbi:MAG: 4Fe-4S binding protein [Bacillota bacterium]|nr:4Fe-4S binding protein [Bacillota bacterium]